MQGFIKVVVDNKTNNRGGGISKQMVFVPATRYSSISTFHNHTNANLIIQMQIEPTKMCQNCNHPVTNVKMPEVNLYNCTNKTTKSFAPKHRTHSGLKPSLGHCKYL